MPVPESTYKNSAGRLLAVMMGMERNKTFREILPKMFPAGPGIPIEITCARALNELYEMGTEVMQDLGQVPEGQRGLLGKGLNAIPSKLGPANIDQSYQGLTEAEQSVLELAASMIGIEGVLGADDIEQIRASIAELRKLVEDATVPPALKKVLLDLIRMSEDAIARFNIHGARGFRKAFKSMLAEAVEAYGLTASDDDDQEKTRAWSVILTHLKIIDAIASKVMQYRPLLEAGLVLLLSHKSN